MTRKLTFVHRFGGGVICELSVDDQPPEQNTAPLVHSVLWTGRPKKKHIPAYRQWILVTFQTLVDRWQKRILYALGTSPCQTELWTFEPGRPPKLEKKLPIGL